MACPRAREMAKAMKCSLCKHEDPSMIPLDAHKKLSVVACLSNPSTAEIGPVRPCLKEYGGEGQREAAVIHVL